MVRGDVSGGRTPLLLALARATDFFSDALRQGVVQVGCISNHAPPSPNGPLGFCRHSFLPI